MPFSTVNGVRLHYTDTGGGEPVVLVMGTGSTQRAWQPYQVPALVAAGYRVITFDHRGIPPSGECAPGYTVDDLVDDVAGLIDAVAGEPCRVVGTSLGAHVTQELALARPDLVRQAVLMATRGRSDAFSTAVTRAEAATYADGATVPAAYRAVVEAMRSLSRRTLEDDQLVTDWLDVLELGKLDGPGVAAQWRLPPMPDRLAAYRGITVPCHVIAFADDLLTPPRYGREVAAAIPGATFVELPDCGHCGYLEEPAAVNDSILRFFAKD
jgi:pimeloyl-ACP methyl ester carboxylesterase